MTHVKGPLGVPRPLAQRRRRVTVVSSEDITGPLGVIPRPLAKVEIQEGQQDGNTN